MTWRTYAFDRVRDGVREMGIVSGDTPETAMQRCLGSHPKVYGITYAMIYLPDFNDDPNSDYTREWGELYKGEGCSHCHRDKNCGAHS